ncbi:hypothetical protein [Deferrisoma sp.]
MSLKRTLETVVMMVLVVALAGAARAQLPAPQLMPGFPMLAGPNVMVMWMPVPGAVKYNVYMNGQKLGETPAVNYMAPAPEKAGEYTFEVAAVDQSGAEGARASGKVKIIKLEPPKGLAAMARGERIGLRWDAAEGAVVYNVYRSENKDEKGDLLGSVQATKYDDTKVEDGKTYYYRVTARDMSGTESAPSEPLEVKYEAPKQAAGAAAKVEEILVEAKDRKCQGSAGLENLQFPGDLAFDRESETLYVVDGGTKKVYVFSADLEHLATWPGEGADWQFNIPVGIGIDPAGEPIYVTDTKALWAFDRNGGVIWRKEYKELGKEFKYFNDVTVAEDGTIYAIDSKGKRLAVLDPDGRLLESYDTSKDAGTTMALNLNHKGNLILTDPLSAKVFEMDFEGNTQRSFGEFGVIPGKMGRAEALAEYAPDKVLVLDSMATRMHLYTMDGQYLGDLAMDGKALPAISSAGVAFVPGKNWVFWSEKLEHRVCRVTVPELP